MARRSSSVTPQRTCVGCRARVAKSDLLRVVAVGDRVVLDLSGRLVGRGAHLHPDIGCFALAERRRAWSRALHVPGPLDAAAVSDHLQQVARDGL